MTVFPISSVITKKLQEVDSPTQVTTKNRQNWDLTPAGTTTAPMFSSKTFKDLLHPKENKSSGHCRSLGKFLAFSIRSLDVPMYLQFGDIQIHAQISLIV